ncbi:MAG: hypothetical protein ACREM8_13525, partial [Vulcanimicrobiaceae bacterium]
MDFVSPKSYTFSDEVLAALEMVDQGTVLERVPLVYAANGAHPILEQTARAVQGRTAGVHLIEIDAMVTTQTCDIRGLGARTKPFLTVAPVYPARFLTNNPLRALRLRTYTVPLTGARFSAELHIADLRFESTIEKGIVVGRGCHPPFVEASEYAELAKKLGESRRRAAFDPTIEKYLLKP